MKIILMLGVAATNVKKSHYNFLNILSEKLNCETDVFHWKKDHHYIGENLPFKIIRNFTCEVIVDFQTSILNAQKIKVPKADVYIGHSAGSIIAFAQKNSNCITLGSPISLVETMNEKDKDVKFMMQVLNHNKERKVLNIIQKYDIISYPINKNNVENFTYSDGILKPLYYLPITSHFSYWRSKKVINKIVKTIKEWQ